MLSDYGFKKTFGNEADTLFLTRALQALIQSPVPIKIIEFTRNEKTGITVDGRSTVFDILCEDTNGVVYLIEMQVREVEYFLQRMKYYSLHAIDAMVRKGTYKFDNLKPIYIISFLGQNAFPNKHYYQIGQIKNQYGEVMDTQTTYIIVELAKWNMEITDIKNDLDKLICLMKTTEIVTKKQKFTPPPFFKEDWIESALKELDLINMDPKKAHNYIAELVRLSEIERIIEKDKLKAIEKVEQEKAIAIEKIEQEKAIAIEKIEQEKAIAIEKIEQEKAIAIEKIEQEKAIALRLEQEKAITLRLEREQAELALLRQEQESEKEKIIIIKNMLLLNTLSTEQIAQLTNYPLEKIKVIKAILDDE